MKKNSNSIIEKIYKKHRVKRYFQLFFGLLLAASAFNLFILPNNIVCGGVSGISIIIRNFVDIDASLIIFVLSIILLIISYIFLGEDKTKASLLGSILFPVFVKLTSGIVDLFPLESEDQLLFAIFGGVLYGLGVGLVFKAGFTTGGTDILNQIMQKYAKTSLGTAMLIIDGSIVVLGGFIFGFTKFMYAILVLYIISYLVDKVLLGISDSKAFYIITSKKEEVSSFVIDELHHSITEFDAEGGYSKEKNPVLFTVIPTKEYTKFKDGIKAIDDKAFFTVIDAYEVIGGE